jgi:hypothetical protein
MGGENESMRNKPTLLVLVLVLLVLVLVLVLLLVRTLVLDEGSNSGDAIVAARVLT